MKKIGRNDACPCGSGKKFKKCCLTKWVHAGYTRGERDSALAKLLRFVERKLGPEDDQAFDEFWGRFVDHADGLDHDLEMMSEHVCDLWFAFDWPLDDGQLVVDRFLDEQAFALSEGEKLCLRTLRASSMRLYEIEDALPGESLTLRDVVEGDRLTVRERLGSRSLNRFDWIAARVVSTGVSGHPEIEGLFQIPEFFHQGLRHQLRTQRDAHLRSNPGATVDSFYKMMPPAFHEVWVGAILDPFVPRLANTDGEEMVMTCVLFDVLDRPALKKALDGAEGVEGEGEPEERELWYWSGTNLKGEPVILGRMEIRGETLRLEVNSLARGERGCVLLEAVAGAAVRHRATTHEDLRRSMRGALRSGEVGSQPRRADDIAPEVREALVLDHSARHLRSWLDEPVPALDDRTPRTAAGDKALRPRLVDLLHDLDRSYQRSLKMGAPACDPSWIWDALGLEEEPAPYPPPLAHERVAQLVPGSGELCRSVAESIRRQPGFKDVSTVFSGEEFRANLELQRFLRQREVASAGDLPAASPGLAAYLELMVNFDLHRRKSFWVDESLAYMLANTDLDVLGRELRVPFPSFALVFTGRHVLSLAERLVARQRDCPLAGQYLRVATVFVTEYQTGEERTLQICFALDALGADLPHLVPHRLPVKEERKVESYLDAIAPHPPIEPVVPHANPLRGLLQVTINAILYATSAGVEPQARQAPAGATGRPQLRGGSPITYSSDEVFFLPGAIEISKVRRLQELDRVPDGRTILRRFMVRGHWRRPAANWAEQRMRWIQPYWKGPDMAAVIERTYKLKP